MQNTRSTDEKPVKALEYTVIHFVGSRSPTRRALSPAGRILFNWVASALNQSAGVPPENIKRVPAGSKKIGWVKAKPRLGEHPARVRQRLANVKSQPIFALTAGFLSGLRLGRRREGKGLISFRIALRHRRCFLRSIDLRAGMPEKRIGQ